MSVALQGHLELRAEARADGRTVLAHQSFRVPYHVGKAYADHDTGVLHVQVANPTAGILAGDALRLEIAIDEGAKLLVTTPSASRVYAMNTGEARCRQDFAVAAGGWLEMLPEPLVPHRQSVYKQETRLDLAAGAGAFFVDQLMPGRLGHGEAWAWERLVLNLDVRVAGKLVLRERLEQSGGSLRAMADAAGTGASSCFANAIWVAPGDLPIETSLLEKVRAAHTEACWFGATEVGPRVWSLRWVAANNLALRDSIREVRQRLAAIQPELNCSLRRV